MKKLLLILALCLPINALATNFPLPEYQAIDSNGDPLVGAVMYFYEDGTTTPLEVYSDADLSSSLGTSLTSDSSGYFDRFFMTSDEAYKVVLKDSSAVTLWSVDVLWANNLVSDSLNERIKQIASNPLDYGAIGDGVSDESTEVQLAVDNATGVVDLLGLTFRCDSAITLDDNITLQNGTLDFSNCSDNEYITVTGSQESGTALTANVSRGARTVAVTSASGLSEGDWVIIKSDDLWGSDNIGEIAQVKGISSLNITMTAILDGGYLTADNAELIKINPKDAITLRNLDIIASTSASGDGNVFVADTVTNLYIDNVRFDGFKGAAIYLKKAVNSFLSNVDIYGYGDGKYAFRMSEMSKSTRITDSSARAMNISAIEISGTDSDGGVVRDTYVDGLNALGFGTGVNIDEVSERLTITNSLFISDDSGSDYGLYGTGAGLTVLNTTWKGVDDLIIFQDPDLSYIDSKPWAVNISDNKFYGGSRAVDLGDNQGDITVSNNIMDTPTGYGVYINTGVENVVVENNIITDPGTSGIAFVGTADSINVSGNIINGTANTYGIYFGLVSELIVSGNILNDAAASSTGIYIATLASGVESVQVLNNRVIDYSTGVAISCASTGLESLIVSGNSVSGVNSAGDFCLAMSGTIDDITIMSNTFSRADDASINLYENATCDSATATGNIINGGTYGMYNLGKASTFKISSNIFASISTANTFGTFTDLDANVSSNTADITTNANAITVNEGDIETLQEIGLRNWLPGVVEGADDGNILDVALGEDGSGNDLWVAVGVEQAAGVPPIIYTSYNGTHWNEQTPAGAFNGALEGVEFGGGNWVAVGDSGEIQTSQDAITWTAETAAGAYAGTFNGVGYDGSALWVLVGESGEIQTASDPTGTWTARSADGGYSDTFVDVHFDDSLWVIVGVDYEIQTSGNGTTWTQRKTGSGANPAFYSVYFGNSTWVAVGGDSNENMVFSTSDPTGTWVSRTTGLRSGQQNLADVKWDSSFSKFYSVGYQDIATGLDPGCISSPDGTTWTVEKCPSSSDDITAFDTDNSGMIVIVGRDAQNWRNIK